MKVTVSVNVTRLESLVETGPEIATLTVVDMYEL